MIEDFNFYFSLDSIHENLREIYSQFILIVTALRDLVFYTSDPLFWFIK